MKLLRLPPALLLLVLLTTWSASGCIFPSEFDEAVSSNDVLDTADANEDADGDVSTGQCDNCTIGQLCCPLADGDGTTCVSVDFDPGNCGGCGKTCGAGAFCQNGDCLCIQDDATECGGACVDLRTSSEHCGACDNACAEGVACDDGRCGTCEGPSGTQPRACVEGETCCEGVGCQDLGTSRSHCGACDTACGIGESCVDGACACGEGDPCAAGAVCCDGVCCAGGQLCCQGTCHAPADAECECNGGPACALEESCCDSGCSTLDARDNCGACGVVCQNNQICSNDACTCETGFGDCDGDSGNGCETTLTSSDTHCGACNFACGTGTTCTSGECLCGGIEPCLSGESCCGNDHCSALDDVDDCGTCGNSCTTSGPRVQGGVCNNGSCQLVCQTGYADCNGDANDGCEVNLNTSTRHCGTCNNPCGQGEVCELGSCECPSGSQCSCSSNETYCDPPGDCKNLNTDPQHCGTCNNACDPTFACVGGSCLCPSGTTECNGTCIDTDSDDANCGSCGHACGGDLSCCGGQCVYPNSDSNCGGCGVVCAETEVCCSGNCVTKTMQDMCSCATTLQCQLGAKCCNGDCLDGGLPDCGGPCIGIGNVCQWNVGQCKWTCTDTKEDSP